MDIYILTFIITGLYDVLLRYISLENLMSNALFVTSLVKYYEVQPLLSVVLTAGFVGAFTQIFIKLFTETFAKKYKIAIFLIATFIISALMGFPMKASGLFPILDATYYKELGWKRAMFTDGLSGLIVNITFLTLCIFIGLPEFLKE